MIVSGFCLLNREDAPFAPEEVSSASACLDDVVDKAKVSLPLELYSFLSSKGLFWMSLTSVWMLGALQNRQLWISRKISGLHLGPVCLSSIEFLGFLSKLRW